MSRPRSRADDIVTQYALVERNRSDMGPSARAHSVEWQSIFIFSARSLEKSFVGVQPTFGYEGDPMRLLFEHGFAPTHAFSAFYQFMKHRA